MRERMSRKSSIEKYVVRYYGSKKTVTFNADSVENHRLAFSGFVVMEIGVRKKGMPDKSKWNCDRQI